MPLRMLIRLRLASETMRVRALLPILLAACQVAEPDRVEVAADSAAGEVAFELAGPNDAALVVPVRINGAGPFDFALDTGATLTCLDRALADSLSLPDVQGIQGVGAGIGGGGRVRLVRIDSLATGNARAEDLSACVVDLSDIQAMGVEIDGLLGLNFVKEFRVTLDFDRNIMTLEPEGG